MNTSTKQKLIYLAVHLVYVLAICIIGLALGWLFSGLVQP